MTVRSRGRLPDDDVGRYLGFFGVVPWLLYALFVIEISYLALAHGGMPAHTPIGYTALAVAIAAMLLIATPSRTPLPAWRTIAVLCAIVFVSSAITWQQPFHDRPPYYVSWELNPCDLLMFCLAIRGRILSAWIGQAAMLSSIALWSVFVTGSPAYGLSFSYTQPFPLLAVSVFAYGFQWTARQILAHRAAERERAEHESRRSADDLDLETDLRIIRDLAGPTLEDIANGRRPDHAAVRGLEAALRDLIRGRNLVAEPLVTTLRVLRERGTDIVLLDDLGDDDLTADERKTLTAWAATRVARASAATAITLRLTRVDGTPLVTITIDGRTDDALRLTPASS